MTTADETPAQPRACTSCGATGWEYDRDACTRQVCPMRDAERSAQPAAGQIWEWLGQEQPRDRFRIESAERDAVTLIPLGLDNRPFVRVGRRNLAAEYQLVADVQPDVAPAPDGNAGGAGVYEVAARLTLAGMGEDNPGETVLTAWSGDRTFRAGVDAGRAPLLADLAEAERKMGSLRTEVASVRSDYVASVLASNAHLAKTEGRLAEAIRERDEARANQLPVGGAWETWRGWIVGGKFQRWISGTFARTTHQRSVYHYEGPIEPTPLVLPRSTSARPGSPGRRSSRLPPRSPNVADRMAGVEPYPLPDRARRSSLSTPEDDAVRVEIAKRVLIAYPDDRTLTLDQAIDELTSPDADVFVRVCAVFLAELAAVVPAGDWQLIARSETREGPITSLELPYDTRQTVDRFTLTFLYERPASAGAAEESTDG